MKILIILTFITIIIFFLLIRRLYKLSKSWTAVEGVIIESKIKEHPTPSPSLRGPINYSPIKIEYKYEVNGVEYTSNRISHIEFHRRTEKYLNLLIGCYPEGKTNEVLYNPKNPTYSIIKK